MFDWLTQVHQIDDIINTEACFYLPLTDQSERVYPRMMRTQESEVAEGQVENTCVIKAGGDVTSCNEEGTLIVGSGSRFRG